MDAPNSPLSNPGANLPRDGRTVQVELLSVAQVEWRCDVQAGFQTGAAEAGAPGEELQEGAAVSV